ncbi:MAG TPA: hypothetical protein VEU54_07025 [Steroidobacteraceae bacterium]|jgi:hypothetical protein|nr:hypothetical protein [Steroidobacteraceae bacterium]
MLLQCEIEGRPSDEDARATGAWLRTETLESLLELNDLCLALLAEQAAASGAAAGTLLGEVGGLWRPLDGPARRRAAACPYLLLDAGFAERERWRCAAPGQVGDAAHVPYGSFFTVPRAIEVGRLILTFAWHLARSQASAARLLLGMPTPCAALIAQYTLRHIHALAEGHPHWLRPRWAGQPAVWRELLLAAASGEARPLEQAHMHGVTLLAAEWRRAARATSPAGTASTVPNLRCPARP